MPLFNPLNAADMGRRSVEARKAKKEAERIAKLQPLPPADPPAPTDDYVAHRLVRVRGILSLIDAKAEAENDPQASSWWATAAARWSEQEFDLAGRPKPGNRRPGPERGAKAGGVFWGAPRPSTAPPKPDSSPE